jgi:hypothetical protein
MRQMDIDFSVIEELVLQERFAVSTTLSDDRTIVLRFAVKDVTGNDPVLDAIRQVKLFALSPTEIIAARGILAAKMHHLIRVIQAIQDECDKLAVALQSKYPDVMLFGDYVCVLDEYFRLLPLSTEYKEKTRKLLQQIIDHANSL